MGLGGGGEGLGCVGRGARCSARNSGRSLGVTAALDPTQRRADALCQIRVVSAGKKKAPPSPKPQQQQKKPNLELQRSDDRKAISQLVVCEGIRVGERIKQTHQKE